MSETTFTPGPWRVEPGDDGDSSVGLNGYAPSVYVDFGEEEGQVGEICRVLRPVKWSGSLRTGDLEQHEFGDPSANAHLIAAAPDMYQALKQWMCPACGGSKVYTGYSKDAPYGSPCRKCADTDGLHPIAFAALAKAVGK